MKSLLIFLGFLTPCCGAGYGSIGVNASSGIVFSNSSSSEPDIFTGQSGVIIGTSTSSNIPAASVYVYGTSTFPALIASGTVGIGTTAPNSTLQVNGNISLTSSSTVSITVPTGALLAGACDSATSSIDSTVTSTTAKFAIAPQVDAGDQYYYKAFISAPSVLTAKVCAITAGTPATTTLNIGIFK